MNFVTSPFVPPVLRMTQEDLDAAQECWDKNKHRLPEERDIEYKLIFSETHDGDYHALQAKLSKTPLWRAHTVIMDPNEDTQDAILSWNKSAVEWWKQNGAEYAKTAIEPVCWFKVGELQLAAGEFAGARFALLTAINASHRGQLEILRAVHHLRATLGVSDPFYAVGKTPKDLATDLVERY